MASCPDLCAAICCCCYTNGECCGCLKNLAHNPKHKYPNIEYYSPEVANGTVDMPEQTYHKVPLHKIFDFPQESPDFGTHPQIPRARGGSLVTRQPTVDDSMYPTNKPRSKTMSRRPTLDSLDSLDFDDPMYITDKGRSHTFSQIPDPPQQSGTPSPEPPPFTPPPQFRMPLLGRSATIAESPREYSEYAAPTKQQLQQQLQLEKQQQEKQDDQLQKVKFALYYDVQRRTLIIHLQQAFNLPPREVHKAAGNFVTLFLLPSREETHQTSVVTGTSPMFNQVFEFGGLLSDEVRQQVLVFQVFYHDKFGRDNLIGTVIMPLKEVDLYGMDITKEIGEGRDLLKKFVTGDLLLSVRYSPEYRKLQGIVLKATNLPRPHKWGLADPYIKVYLLHHHKRLTKWKSTIKKSTLAPVFNEAFEFDISNLDSKDICLEIFVMDHDRFRRNDVVGIVYFGAQVPNESGSSHYEEVMANPGHPVSYWHQLIPHQQIKKRKRHKSQTL